MNGSGRGDVFNGNDELHTSQPAVPLAVVYGTTVAVLVVLAVVIVVIAILYHKRQEKHRIYYTFAKTITILKRQYSTRGSMRSSADQHHQQLRRSMEDTGENMELFLTQEETYSLSEPTHSANTAPTAHTPTTAVPSHAALPQTPADRVKCTVTIEDTGLATERSGEGRREVRMGEQRVEGEGIRKGERGGEGESEGDGGIEEEEFEERECSEDVGINIYDDIPTDAVVPRRKQLKKRTSEQFSFEDGTLLHDYPPSVDHEVSGDREDPQKANIIGYCDIYSSQILHITPSGENSSPQDEGESHHLKPAMTYGTEQGVNQRSLEVNGSAHYTSVNSQALSGLVVPILVVEDVERSRSTLSQDQHHSDQSPSPPATPPSNQSASPMTSSEQLMTSAEEPMTSSEQQMTSSELVEAQEILDRSLTDLLEMTEALSDEMDGKTEKSGAHHMLRRQHSSLPSLLDTPSNSNTPTPNLTRSQDALLLPLSPTHTSLPPTSRCSDVNLSEVITASELADLDPEIRIVLLGSDADGFEELQIAHV